MFASSLLCSSQNSLSFNCGDNGSTTVILKPVVSSPHRQLANFAPPQFRAPPAPSSLRPPVKKPNLLAPLNDENRAPPTFPLVLIPQLYPKRNDANTSQSQPKSPQTVSTKSKVLNKAPTISINRRDQTTASKPLPSTLQLMHRLPKRANEKLIVVSQTTSWGSLFDWHLSQRNTELSRRVPLKKKPLVAEKRETVSAVNDVVITIDSKITRQWYLIEASDLPDEILITIFSSLSPQELLGCMMVCWQWYRIACDSSLWQPIWFSMSGRHDINLLTESIVREESIRNWRMAYVELKREMKRKNQNSVKQYSKKRSQSLQDLSVMSMSLSMPSTSSILSILPTNLMPSSSSSSSSSSVSSSLPLSLSTSSLPSSSTSVSSSTSASTLTHPDSGEKKRRTKRKRDDLTTTTEGGGSDGDTEGDWNQIHEELADFNRNKRAYFSKFEGVSLSMEEG